MKPRQWSGYATNKLCHPLPPSQLSIDVIDRIFQKSLESRYSILPAFSLDSYGLPFFHYTKNSIKCTKNQYICTKYFTETVLNCISQSDQT